MQFSRTLNYITCYNHHISYRRRCCNAKKGKTCIFTRSQLKKNNNKLCSSKSEKKTNFNDGRWERRSLTSNGKIWVFSRNFFCSGAQIYYLGLIWSLIGCVVGFLLTPWCKMSLVTQRLHKNIGFWATKMA